MELRRLEAHIRMLAMLEETNSPVISCYLDLRNGVPGYRDELNMRLQLLRKSLPTRSLPDFEDAVSRLEEGLGATVSARTRGFAAFTRGGKRPFQLLLDFEVPLPNWIAAGPTPNIYHLAELKDNYDRYVILLMTETNARIIGVNLGSVTEQLWGARPDLRQRVGHEWTRDHFQHHRRERTRQFIHDQIRGLEQVVSAGRYGHLILAGNVRMIAAVRRLLPKRLAARLIDSVPAGPVDRMSDIVASTLEAFLEHEEEESQAIAEKLITQVHTHGLAVAGTRPCMAAIQSGQADYLVVVKGYDPGKGWACRGCGEMHLTAPRRNRCPRCGADRVMEFDIREELVRCAERHQVGIEVVKQNDTLMRLGGVGCLLRYLAPANYLTRAA